MSDLLNTPASYGDDAIVTLTPREHIRLRPGGHCLLPAGCIFGARELSGRGAAFGCVVVPGYEDDGLRLYTADQLRRRFPESWRVWAALLPPDAWKEDDR